MKRTRRLFCLLGLGLVVGQVGCLSPTLPLPPPGEPEVASVGQGIVTLSGRIPEPSVPVLARNDNSGTYAGKNADESGHYRFPIAAEPGDRMRIWYLVANEPSNVREFVVPDFELGEVDTLEVSPSSSEGLVTVSGTVPNPLAQVYVSNQRTGRTIDDASDEEGRFSLGIAANAGDAIEVWYKFGSNLSPVVVVRVPPN